MPSAFAQRSCSPHMLASFAPLGSPSLMHGSSDFNYIAIHARNVTLSLGSTQILKGIDLSIVRGESLAILGPSGSGKSSLMAILSGLERASGGDVRVAGIDYGPLNEDGLARARRGRVGIVLQSFPLLPTMTSVENVAVPLEIAGASAAFARAAAELEAVGQGTRLPHNPAQLSCGEPSGEEWCGVGVGQAL